MIKQSIKYALCFSLAALIASCSNDKVQSSDNQEREAAVEERQRTFVFECDEKFEFVAQLVDGKTLLFLPGRTVALEEMQGFAGKRFGDSDTSFGFEGPYGWYRGKEGEYQQCTNNRGKAVWEDAKLRGVDFRAVGNEPGWHVELWPDNISYAGDYGDVRHSFTLPEPQIDSQAASTVYQIVENGVSFKMQIRGAECRDDMSGETYPTEVTIWVDERELRGCGKALH